MCGTNRKWKPLYCSSWLTSQAIRIKILNLFLENCEKAGLFHGSFMLTECGQFKQKQVFSIYFVEPCVWLKEPQYSAYEAKIDKLKVGLLTTFTVSFAELLLTVLLLSGPLLVWSWSHTWCCIFCNLCEWSSWCYVEQTTGGTPSLWFESVQRISSLQFCETLQQSVDHTF